MNGALERRVWTSAMGKRLYPNLFILLVARPGVGKTVAIDEVADLWAETQLFHVAPTSITKASLIDQLAAAKQTAMTSDGMDIYHSLLIPSGEFGVFAPGYDSEFLNRLNVLFDCQKQYKEATRHKGVIEIDYPHISLISGTQPGYLAHTLPTQAFTMGFTSRLMMIYASEPVKRKLFSTGDRLDLVQRNSLIKDLKNIGHLNGPYKWDDDVAEAVEAWAEEGMTPAPSHTRLINYNPRRIIYIMKLSMIYAAARRDDLIVTMEDFESAKETLLEAEALMPMIFDEMGSSGDEGHNLDEAFGYVVREYQRKKRPIPKSDLSFFLSRRVPPYMVEHTIRLMFEAEMIKDMTPPGSSFTVIAPGGKGMRVE